MQNSSTEGRRPNCVRATFKGGMSNFLLAYDATFADLAERLGNLAEGHHGRPIAIEVRLGAVPR
jgi:hypothetical protein